ALDVFHVHADGLGTQPDGASAHLYAFGHLIDPQCATIGEKLFSSVDAAQYLHGGMALHHVHKIFHVAGYVETDKVTLQQASDDVTSPGDYVKNIRRRKGRMVEEANLQVGAALAQESGDHPQIVFVDPYKRVGFGLVGHAVCKQLVYTEIVFPM